MPAHRSSTDGSLSTDTPAVQRTITTCLLTDCREPGHVVLYAAGNQLAGRPTYERMPVVFCLKHGGEIYDVIRAWQTSETRLPSGVIVQRVKHAPCPAWLVTDLLNDRLPRTSPDPRGWQPASVTATTRSKKGR